MSHQNDGPVVTKLLRRKDKVEALSWLTLAGTNSGIGEMSKRQSLQLVNALYKLGAVEVIAVDIRGSGDLASTDSLVVTLPESSEQRRAIIDWNNDRARKMGFDPEPDAGQQHILVWFD